MILKIKNKGIVFILGDACLLIDLLTWKHICFVFSCIHDLRHTIECVGSKLRNVISVQHLFIVCKRNKAPTL